MKSCVFSCPSQVWPRYALRRSLVARASAGDFSSAREAISCGIGLCNEERFADALPVFEAALSLPGTGIKQFRDKPPALSDGERQACLYNIACCHAKTGDMDACLQALEMCLEAGYEDWATIEADDDLAAVRADERFAALKGKYGRGSAGGLNPLLSAFKSIISRQ